MDDMSIPTTFWSALTIKDYDTIFSRKGQLDDRLIALLWRKKGRTGRPPRKLRVMVDLDQLAAALRPG